MCRPSIPPSPSSGRRYAINIIIYVNQVRRPDITGRYDLLQSMKCSHLPFQADLGSLSVNGLPDLRSFSLRSH